MPKVLTRKKQFDVLSERIKGQKELLGLSDSIEEGNKEIIRVASEIEQTFDSAEDVSIAFNHYTNESQHMVDIGVDLVHDVVEVLDALDATQIELPRETRGKVKKLGNTANRFINRLQAFDIAFERVRAIFENTALYKVIAERLKKDKEDYEEASAEIKSEDRNGWSPDENGVMQPNKSAYDDATSGGVGGVNRELSM